MKNYSILMLVCGCSSAVCNERVEVQSHAYHRGKPVALATVMVNSDDTIQQLRQDIIQELQQSGVALNTTAQPQQNTYIIDKIEAGKIDLTAPALQNKTVAVLLPEKKHQGLWKSIKKLYEPQPEPLVLVHVELSQN